ncbi:hypothetical protein HBB16_04020 [Pseudonocardia sp. MCCB 268]|nr:hypothetical protein [Pseudonocardia cytotoxica]
MPAWSRPCSLHWAGADRDRRRRGPRAGRPGDLVVIFDLRVPARCSSRCATGCRSSARTHPGRGPGRGAGDVPRSRRRRSVPRRGLIVLGLGLSGLIGTVSRWLPQPIVMAMIAGALIKFGTGVVTAAGSAP